MTSDQIKDLTEGGLTMPEIFSYILAGKEFELGLILDRYKALNFTIKLNKAKKNISNIKLKQLKLNLA